MHLQWQMKQIDLPEFRAPVGKLLTLSADEALKVGYSEGTVNRFREVLQKAGLEDAKLLQ